MAHQPNDPAKTAAEWQQEIDAQREQNLAWVSNIGAFMVHTDKRMEHLTRRSGRLHGGYKGVAERP